MLDTSSYMKTKLMAEDSSALHKLVLDAKNGDVDSFSELYTATYEKIFRFVYFRVSHKEIAEDLTEEIFIKAYGQISNLKNPDVVVPWLYQIAKNKIIDYYRAKKNIEDISDFAEILQSSDSPVDATQTSYEQAALLKNLQLLPLDQQAVIRLKFFEDLDNAKIAVILEKSEGNIRVLQHRAITQLTKLLNP